MRLTACGFRTEASGIRDYEKIKALAEAIASLGEIDAYMEISPNSNRRLLTCCHKTFKGRCSECTVPVGLFKAMQITAG